MACVYGHIQSPEGEVGCPQASVVGGCDLAVKSTGAKRSHKVTPCSRYHVRGLWGCAEWSMSKSAREKTGKKALAFCRGYSA